MVNAHREAIERLYKDTCTVYTREKQTDENTHLTSFAEAALYEAQPCKLSFESLNAASGDEVPTVQQSVKLFCSPDLDIPAGCKIVVERSGRTFEFAKSGLAGVFSDHQEIMLEPFRGYA